MPEQFWQGPIVRSYDTIRVVVLTQAQYDAIPTPDPNTLYLITA